MTAPARLKSTDRQANSHPARLTSSIETILSALVLAAFIGAALLGWANRDRLDITPESGLGYALGIFGASMMLLLAVYPLRKRLTGWRWLGSVGLWFRMHMLLGLIGPLAILFHSRFRWSATNSGGALWSVLVVVAAGLIGCLPYRHVYRGYELRRLEARELLEEVVASRAALDADGDAGKEVRRELEALESETTHNSRGLVRSLGSMFSLSVRTRVMSFSLKRRVREHFARTVDVTHWHPSALKHHQRAAARHLDVFLYSVREAAGLALYDRLLRLWHFLHLPLYLFMAVAVIVHIIAVHMY